MTESRSRQFFVDWWAYLALFVIALSGVLVVALKFGNDAAMAPTAAYVIFESVVAILALTYLDAVVERQELTAFRSAVGSAAPTREAIVALLDSALDRIDGAYTTAVNILFALGMIGSAGFFVFYFNSQAVTDAVLKIAPKAFTSTAFALCCGAVISVRAQIPIVRKLRLLAHGTRSTERPGVVLEHDPGSSAELKNLTRAVIRSLVQFTEVSNAFGSRLNLLSRSVEELNTAIAQREAQHSRTLESIEEMVRRVEAASTSIAAVVTEPVANAALQAAQSSADLVVEARLVKDHIKRLNDILVEERKGLLQQHGDALAKEAHRLLEGLLLRSETVIQTKLNAITGSIQQKASEAYETAYKAAADRLREVLSSVTSQTDGLGSSLAHTAEALRVIAALIETLSTSMEKAAGTADTTTARYGEAVQRLTSAADELASIHIDGEGATFIADLHKATQTIGDAVTEVGGRLNKLDAERSKLIFAKSRLIEIARRPRSDHD